MAISKISVVLPTYNHLCFLAPVMEDIYRQTRADWELIVVNDGSTDGTAAWLDGQDHPQLTVIHQENRGAAEAINTGIRAARGEYLTWVSADNRASDYLLEALAAPLDLDPGLTMAYSPYFGIDEHGQPFTIKFDNIQLLRELVSNVPRGNAGFLYRRAVHDRVGMYEGWVCDTLMWARILDGGTSVYVLEPTYYYRFHNNRATLHRRSEVDAARPGVMADFLARIGGQVDVDALHRLYPMLGRSPNHLVDAAIDFSVRMAANQATEAALNLQLALLASAPITEAFRPIAAFLACAQQVPGVDALTSVNSALARNSAIEFSQRAALVQLAASLHAANKAGMAIPPQMLEHTHPLLALEKPRVFSFLAWRERGEGIVQAH